jgi:hypothetical protein
VVYNFSHKLLVHDFKNIISYSLQAPRRLPGIRALLFIEPPCCRPGEILKNSLICIYSSCFLVLAYSLLFHIPHGRDRDRETRFEMFVSNEAVGSVIGRRGAKINEIRAMSGARINVLESGTKGRGGGGRGGSPEPDRERIIGKLAPLLAVLRNRVRIFLGLLDPDADPQGCGSVLNVSGSGSRV